MSQENPDEQSVENMILYSVENNVAYIKLNRPKKLNAMNVDCLKRILKLLKKADLDENVKVIVFKSTGRAFSAGYDLSGFGGQDLKWPSETHIYGTEISRGLYLLKKPAICQLEGMAIGWGCILLFACDFRFVANDPKIYFYLPELKMGIPPATGPTFGPIKVLGLAKAKEMLFMDKRVGIEEFDKWGGITKICEPDKLDDEVREFAENMANMNSTILYSTKTALNIMGKRFVKKCFDLEMDLAGYFYNNLGNIDPKETDDFLKKMWAKYEM